MRDVCRDDYDDEGPHKDLYPKIGYMGVNDTLIKLTQYAKSVLDKANIALPNDENMNSVINSVNNDEGEIRRLFNTRYITALTTMVRLLPDEEAKRINESDSKMDELLKEWFVKYCPTYKLSKPRAKVRDYTKVICRIAFNDFRAHTPKDCLILGWEGTAVRKEELVAKMTDALMELVKEDPTPSPADIYFNKL